VNTIFDKMKLQRICSPINQHEMKRPAVLFTLLFVSAFLFAQRTAVFNDPQLEYKQAKDYFQQEYYALAYPIFLNLQQELSNLNASTDLIPSQELRFYAVVCQLKLDQPVAERAASDFVYNERNSALSEKMAYHLAEYYFQRENYADALSFYEKTKIENLSNAEVSNMKFHKGYCHFTYRQFANAKPLFDAIRQMPGDPHYIDANYYYGFILFSEKQYASALDAFKVAENKEPYNKVVPYYIASILYFTGKKDQALTYAENALKKGNLAYEMELNQLVGHAYFEKKQFDKALPYLEKYVNGSEKVRREDIYELSYCYYKAERYGKSIEGFKQLSGKEDSLSQSSMYLLGDAYLKTGNKPNARNAFLFCSLNSNIDEQREVSKFNYAKLSYELGYQDVALRELQEFIELYPRSAYKKEAQELLIATLTNSNNFKDALVLIEGLDNPSESTKRLYPRILYGRAAELVNDNRLSDADAMLDKVIKDPYNAPVLSLANFWKGEIAYRQNRFSDAAKFYENYIKGISPVQQGEATLTNAKYNMGYALLRLENYRQALGYFEQVGKGATITSSDVQKDAYVRAADCYYMNREFNTAKNMYDYVINNAWASADYATYQKAAIIGITNSKDKIELLKGIERKFPSSALVPDANLEIANTYLTDEKFRDAIPFLNNAYKAYNASDAIKVKALLNLGLAYYNLNDNKNALINFNKLLNDYPRSEEAEEALDNIKGIYVEEGRTAEYVAFMNSIGKNVSSSEADSLAYTSAELKYSNGDLTAALAGFNSYLLTYPSGRFAPDANYYSAEIYNGKKDFINAAQRYEAVVSFGSSKYYEKSLSAAARIHYFELANYVKSEYYFNELKNSTGNQEYKMDAMRGLLRSQYKQKKWTEAVANAQDLLKQKNISTDDKVLSNLVIAKSAQDNTQYNEAIGYYKQVALLNKAELGAEARYEIAACYFLLNDLKNAEKAAFEVISKSGSYDWWVTKSYILLGDIYWKQKDYFNAKATYQSIADNSKIPELKAEAADKLQKVTADEKTNSKIQ
jgi:TolA-binding protein